MSGRPSEHSLRLGLVAVAAALVLAAPAQAAGVFTVAGGGTRPLREGALAGTADITGGGDVAADPGGGFAFIDGATLWRVGNEGRAHRLALPRDVYASRIAYAPDGMLYARARDAVWRFARDGTPPTVIAGDPDAAGLRATAGRHSRRG